MRAYSEDLREKGLMLIEKIKSKSEVAELLGIGIATLYRWVKKKSKGESLKPLQRGRFIWKIDPVVLSSYIRRHPDATLKEMSRDLGFGMSSIWYRLKQLKITLKKSHVSIKSVRKKRGKRSGQGLPA